MKNIIKGECYIDTGSIAGDSTAFVVAPELSQAQIDEFKRSLSGIKAMESKITIWPPEDIEEDDG